MGRARAREGGAFPAPDARIPRAVARYGPKPGAEAASAMDDASETLLLNLDMARERLYTGRAPRDMGHRGRKVADNGAWALRPLGL